MNKKKNISRKQSAATRTSEPKVGTSKDTFVFQKENYILLLAGLALIILGFVLMIGGGSDDPTVFSDDIFSFRRMTLAPILILLGYVVEIFAIMHKPRAVEPNTAE